MAMSSLRLRRAIGGFSALSRPLAAAAAATAPAASSAPSSSLFDHERSPSVQPQTLSFILQSRTFRSSPASHFAFRSSQGGGGGLDDEIGPDTILFEGCDYNHWLIVMDFGKENKPTPEEMVRTYEETCAKGLNISIEEAKLKMYACSTTTYNGFQAVMTEEESEKFNGLPGVVFVLPDSYIDPQNKEYGGDKYENGKITHRPPPVQYGRSTGRYRDQPRNDRPRGPMPNQDGNPQYGGQRGPMQGGPIPNQQANPSYGQQGRPMQGGNYGAPQNYPPPQPNYGPPPSGRNPYQQGSGAPAPPYQGHYNQGGHGNYYPREQREVQQGDLRNSAPPPSQQSGFRDDYRNYGQGMGGHQGQGGFGQGASGHQGHGGFGQGAGGHQGHGGFGQGAGGHQGQGGFEQGAGGHQGRDGFGQGAGGNQGQGGFGQGRQGQPGYYPPGNDQGRY